jgi:hypothetical protein
MNVYCPKCGAKNDYFKAKKSGSCERCKKQIFESRAKEKTFETVKVKIAEPDAREFGDSLPNVHKLDVDIQVVGSKKIKLGDLFPPQDNA